MLSQENNDLLTQTGPGTTGGDLLRRYWHPIALSEELPLGSPPKPVKILGEDLALFRDDQGEIGLVGIHCPHRGADLSYGRIEDGGLRCLYHGWLFDVKGHCLEQPAEPEGSEFKNKIKQKAYPCYEKSGIIFTYMGPGEPPLFPNYEFLQASEDYRIVSKVYHECNYLQGNEGNIDPSHVSFLHRFFEDDVAGKREAYRIIQGSNLSANDLQGKDTSPTIETEETDFGVRVYTIRNADENHIYLKVSNSIYPNLSAVAGSTSGDGYTVNWHVPIDNEHHWKYRITFTQKAPIKKEGFEKELSQNVTPDYKLIQNKSNRYQQDREEMKNKTFSGIGKFFPVHDALAWEGQGYIQERTDEHLGYADKAIAHMRTCLLKALKQVKEGKDAPHVIREEKSNDLSNLLVISEVLPEHTDVKEYLRNKVAEIRNKSV